MPTGRHSNRNWQGNGAAPTSIWKEAWTLFDHIPASDGEWIAAARRIFPDNADLDGNGFRDRYFREVLIDSHAGFLLGQIAAGVDFAARPQIHLNALASALREESQESQRLVVDPIATRVGEAARERMARRRSR